LQVEHSTGALDVGAGETALRDVVGEVVHGIEELLAERRLAPRRISSVLRRGEETGESLGEVEHLLELAVGAA